VSIVLTAPNGASLSLPEDTTPAELVELLAALGVRQPPKSDSPYLTVQEAADYLRFPAKRIYNLTSRAEIPYLKQDGRLIFKRADLDEWLESYRVA
jgi:excisionase family DNA binding protein